MSVAQQKVVIEFSEELCSGVIRDRSQLELMKSKWFGRDEGGQHVLSLEEVAYLLMKGRAVVKCSGKTYDELDKLVMEYYKCFSEMFWPRLIVYTDLRDRGRLLKPIGENSYLVKHKDNTLKLLLVMEERVPVSIEDIMEQVEKARKNNLSLIMAIVSLQGDLTYYEVSNVELSK